MKITKMQGSFGAIVDGIDVAQPLDDATMLSLAAALYENRILILDHQELSPAQCAAFGRQWGEPISFFAPDNRDQQFPELIKITNSPSIPEVSRDGAMHWHSDSSYEAIPAAVTMLYAVEAPLTGNDTQSQTPSRPTLPLPASSRSGSNRSWSSTTRVAAKCICLGRSAAVVPPRSGRSLTIRS